MAELGFKPSSQTAKAHIPIILSSPSNSHGMGEINLFKGGISLTSQVRKLRKLAKITEIAKPDVKVCVLPTIPGHSPWC